MTPDRGRLSVLLALLVVVSAVGVAVQPAAAGPGTVGEGKFTDAVTSNVGWWGLWSPDSTVVEYGVENHPGWVVEYTNGSAGDLEAWASASKSRTIRERDNDSNTMLISAPASAVGPGGGSIFSTPLVEQGYVERIGVNRRVTIDPVGPTDLEPTSSWSAPKGSWLATMGGLNGKFDADGAAWGREVNTSTLQTARERANATGLSVNGSGVRVAVLDTGLDYKQSLYGDRVVAGKNVLTNESINTTSGDYSAVADGSSSNHGSWVATAIAGDGAGPNATGIAPGASLIPVKVLGDDGSGTTADIAAGLEYACEEQNADVVSMSLGSELASMQIENEIRECLQDDGVSAIVVAGGNNRMTTRYLQYPGDSENVITVAASDSRPINESESAYFSAVGPDQSTAENPTVAAPGLKITAEVADGNRTLSGTSMATPIVSGVAALTLEAQPQLKGNPVELRTYLEERAAPMPQAGATEVGNGRIHAANAVQDVTPETSQDGAMSSEAEARDGGNEALSGSIWRGFGIPSLSIVAAEAPLAG